MRSFPVTGLLVFAAAALSGTIALKGEAAAQGWGWERPRAPWWAERRWDYDPYEYHERRRYREERRRAWRERDPYFGEDGYLRSDDGFERGDEVRPRGPRIKPPQRFEREPAEDWRDDEDEHRPATASGGARPAIAPKAPPVVAFRAGYAPGSIVIDTSARKLYLVRGPMSAYAYPIGVGRDGFSWTGKEKVSRIADWPDWHPPAEMRKRKPELPERMTGGVNNPLGARAIYLGNTLYRIHGTNEPKSIGRAESSGCFRMMNHHVVHLAGLVKVGAEVSVVRSLGPRAPVTAAAQPATPARTQAARVRTPSLRPEPRVRWQQDEDPYPYYAR